MPNVSGGWTTDQIYCDVIDSQYGDQIFKKVVRECVIRKLIAIEEVGTLVPAEKALQGAMQSPQFNPSNPGYDPQIDRIIRMIYADASGKGSRGWMMPSGDITTVLGNQWSNILKSFS